MLWIGLFAASFAYKLLLALGLPVWIGTVILCAFIAGSLGIRIKTKDELNALVINTEGLDGNEKVIVWISCAIVPFIAGAVFYYYWLVKYPTKAKQADRISFIVVLAYILLAVAMLSILSATRMKAS